MSGFAMQSTSVSMMLPSGFEWQQGWRYDVVQPCGIHAVIARPVEGLTFIRGQSETEANAFEIAACWFASHFQLNWPLAGKLHIRHADAG